MDALRAREGGPGEASVEARRPAPHCSPNRARLRSTMGDDKRTPEVDGCPRRDYTRHYEAVEK